MIFEAWWFATAHRAGDHLQILRDSLNHVLLRRVDGGDHMLLDSWVSFAFSTAPPRVQIDPAKNPAIVDPTILLWGG